MPVIIEPTPGAAFQKLRGVVLNGDQYNISLRYNQTEDAWYMDVADVQDNLIAAGLKIVLGVYIGRQSTHKLFSSGSFFAIDTTNSGQEANYQNFGSTVILSYWLASESAAEFLSELLGEQDTPT